MVDNQFQACVATIKGTIVSPQTPSWIDTQTGKGARLDHLVGLGVEFTCTSGRAAWVGSPFQDPGVILEWRSHPGCSPNNSIRKAGMPHTLLAALLPLVRCSPVGCVALKIQISFEFFLKKKCFFLKKTTVDRHRDSHKVKTKRQSR